MNERIRELADEAGLRFTQLMSNPMVPVVDGKETDLEKFAELIVLKCADIINHRADTCSDWLDSVKANEAVREGQRECAKTIKEHFGVEE
jgi:hypothetical protein